MTPIAQPVVFFGKLPLRGDFVRSATSPALVQSLDRWLSSGIELMADDAHWKHMYDQAPGARFVMMGSQRSSAVAGYLMPSADAAGRRFPFLVATTLQIEGDQIGLYPLMLEPVFTQLSALCRSAQRAIGDAATVLAGLNAAQSPPPWAPHLAREEYRKFLEYTTMAGLSFELQGHESRIDFRQALLALGLLLQPLLTSGPQEVEKGLQLPLPAHEPGRSRVATFWMVLIARFVQRTPHDLSVFMQDVQGAQAQLLVGLSAGSAPALHGLLDARALPNAFVDLTSSTWVEDCVSNDYGLKKLSSYLQLPQMSLAQVTDSFLETFLGS
jgi:type VI secretion system protein ImpM